ncbi:hypothetical protein GCM10009535_16560 [Streptomyces thermocarboxydovorans]|uniref:Uncharacterized protein n=1 Tax=Streptomyces thermocarboxydovorans TaxID=59298 RepID=A0ABP3SL99_9ACTN
MRVRATGATALAVTPYRCRPGECRIDDPRPARHRGHLRRLRPDPAHHRLEGGHAVTPEDLEAAEELAGTRVRAGDIVLVRTGQIRLCLDGDRQGYAHPSPGLSIRTPEWFHARDVAAVAGDTVTFEIFPPEIPGLWLPVHALHLVEMGMPQGQNWDLEKLSTTCGETGRYAFLLSATPEPFTGGTGAPVPPVAVLCPPLVPFVAKGLVRRGAVRPEHGSAARSLMPALPPPVPVGPEGPAPDNDPHSPRTPVEALAVPSRRIAVDQRDQSDTPRQ